MKVVAILKLETAPGEAFPYGFGVYASAAAARQRVHPASTNASRQLEYSRTKALTDPGAMPRICAAGANKRACSPYSRGCPNANRAVVATNGCSGASGACGRPAVAPRPAARAAPWLS